VSEPVLILMGSQSDWDVLREAAAELDRLGIAWRAHVASAHRSLGRTLELVREGEAGGVRVFICGAGMAAHLIGVPLAGGVADGLDALLSTVQMPGGVPVAAVAVGKAGARNAAVLAGEILGLSDTQIEARVKRARAAQANAVIEADAALRKGGERR
jgi:5-(carboxyamino)imidazole ribonucleotide mutase